MHHLTAEELLAEQEAMFERAKNFEFELVPQPSTDVAMAEPEPVAEYEPTP